MLEFFRGKRGGLVSVFLVMILVPVMALGTSLMELSRKRGADNVWSEAADSAASSMLSDYDEKLQKRFGLLAMSQVSSDDKFTQQFKSYLSANLGGADTEISSILTLDDASVEKLYCLNDSTVLRDQILEFSQSRVPVNVALDGVDSLVESVKKKFKDLSSMFNIMKKSCDAAEKLFKMMTEMLEVEEARKDLEVACLKYIGSQYRKNTKEKLDALESAVSKYQKAQKVVEKSQNGLEVKDFKGYSSETKKILNILLDDNRHIRAEYENVAKFLAKNAKNKKPYDKVAENTKANQEWDAWMAEYQKQADNADAVQEYFVHQDNIKDWSDFWGDYQGRIQEVEKAQKDVKTQKDKVITSLDDLMTIVTNWENKLHKLQRKLATMKEKVNALSGSSEEFTSALGSAATAVVKASNEDIYATSEEATDELKTLRQEDKKKADAAADAAEKAVKDASNAYKNSADAVNNLKFSKATRMLAIYQDTVHQLKKAVWDFEKDVDGYLSKKSPCSDIQNVLADKYIPGDLLLGSGLRGVIYNDALTTALSSMVAECAELINKFMENIDQINTFISTLIVNPAYDLRYNVTVDEKTWSAISDHKAKTTSEKDGKDRALAEQKKKATQSVADEIGYDLNSIGPNGTDDGGGQLETIMENIKKDISSLMTSYSSLSNDDSSLVEKVKEAIISELVPIYAMIKRIAVVIIMIHTVRDIVSNIKNLAGELVSMIGESRLYQHLLINTYATDMFTNRATPYTDDRSLMGTKVSELAIHGGSYTCEDAWKPKTGEGSLAKRILNYLKTSVLGENEDATSFAMAETEYIYAGSKNEYLNQLAVYATIFFTRVVANIPAALTNEIAAEMGPFYILGVIFMDVAEAFGDMTFVTNGVSIPIIKTASTAYISIDNLEKLVEKSEKLLTNKISSADFAISIAEANGKDSSDTVKHIKKQKEIKDAFNEAEKKKAVAQKNGTSVETEKTTEEIKEEAKTEEEKAEQKKEKSVWEISYKQYLWILLLFKSDEQKLDRIGNLITMEMRQGYKKGSVKVKNFSLKKAYTYLRVSGQANWEPLLPIPNSVLGYDVGVLHPKEQLFYRGY